MAKNTSDIILRDRMQFTLDGTGSLTTLYGRIDLSQYVSPVSRTGISVKEIRFMLRNPNSGSSTTAMPNTGAFQLVANDAVSGNDPEYACVKVYATTRAYENASDVGIASPDVLCVYELQSSVSRSPDAAQQGEMVVTHENWYGPEDLHPEGYTVVSDLLIGVAVDKWVLANDDVLELDVLIVAEPIKVTESRLNEILSQGLDL